MKLIFVESTSDFVLEAQSRRFALSEIAAYPGPALTMYGGAPGQPFGKQRFFTSAVASGEYNGSIALSGSRSFDGGPDVPAWNVHRVRVVWAGTSEQLYTSSAWYPKSTYPEPPDGETPTLQYTKRIPLLNQSALLSGDIYTTGDEWIGCSAAWVSPTMAAGISPADNRQLVLSGEVTAADLRAWAATQLINSVGNLLDGPHQVALGFNAERVATYKLFGYDDQIYVIDEIADVPKLDGAKMRLRAGRIERPVGGFIPDLDGKDVAGRAVFRLRRNHSGINDVITIANPGGEVLEEQAFDMPCSQNLGAGGYASDWFTLVAAPGAAWFLEELT